MLFGEVLGAQPPHRGDERAGIAGEIEREAIGASFVRPGHRVRDRQHGERHRSGREKQQRQTGDVGGAPKAERQRQPVEHTRRQIEADDNQHAFEHDALPDVAVHVVSQLVRQHDLDLFL